MLSGKRRRTRGWIIASSIGYAKPQYWSSNAIYTSIWRFTPDFCLQTGNLTKTESQNKISKKYYYILISYSRPGKVNRTAVAENINYRLNALHTKYRYTDVALSGVRLSCILQVSLEISIDLRRDRGKTNQLDKPSLPRTPDHLPIEVPGRQFFIHIS